MNERLASLVIVVVVFAFIANFILSAADATYRPDPTIGPIMGTIAGGALAYLAAKRSNGSNGKEKE